MPDNFVGDLNQKLMWKTRGENCVMCNALRGRVYTYDMWMSSGVWPGFHLNCNCYLSKVSDDTPLSDPDFFGADLNLLSDTFNPNLFPLKLHWDPNYKPFAIYMCEEITKAHLSYGAGLSIGQVLKKMNTDYQGFFKRSNIYDNFFIWRTFRTVQHYQNINGDYSGSRSIFSFPKSNFSFPTKNYYQSSPPFFTGALMPASLLPYYPYQSYYTELY